MTHQPPSLLVHLLEDYLSQFMKLYTKDPRFKKWIITERLSMTDPVQTDQERTRKPAIIGLGGKLGRFAGRRWAQLVKRQR